MPAASQANLVILVMNVALGHTGVTQTHIHNAAVAVLLRIFYGAGAITALLIGARALLTLAGGLRVRRRSLRPVRDEPRPLPTRM